MGVGSSTPATQLTQEQRDVKYLGERMPFGDEELKRVYRAYQALRAMSTNDRISFLTDIGVQSVSKEYREERMMLLQAVEHKILPRNFGNRLYETVFLKSKSHSEYARNPSTASVHDQNDSYMQMVKLETFFEGLAQCTRRGNTKALSVLFQCCQPQQSTNNDNGDTAFGIQESPVMVDPLELVTIGYRVGLASGFLATAAKDDGEDVGQFIPEDYDNAENETENTTSGTPTTNDTRVGLQALAESLIDFCNRRKQRYDPTGSVSTLSSTTTTKLVTEEEVQAWAEQAAPMMGSGLATLTHFIFFPERPCPPTRTNFEYPTLGEFTSSIISRGSSPLLFSFACMSPALGGEYYRLYTSASDGLSFNRLQNALLGYAGPTLIIIQSGNSLFGAFTASPWKESKEYYGNHDCFLYQLSPKMAVYRPTGNASNFMYCNSYARSRGYDQQAHGIGFGGTVDQPRLFLAESFDNCRAAPQDMTFESGRLLDNTKGSTFEIDTLEVWGVGGTEVVQEALGARSRQRDIKNAAIQKARKVDKAQFLDDFRSGLIESKAFQHRDQIRGRDACSPIDDDELNHTRK